MEPWSAAIMGGASLFGSFMQGNSAARQQAQALALQQQQLQEQRRQSNLNYQLALQEQQRQKEYDAYQREQNDWSRMFAEQTYDLNRQYLTEDRAQKQDEYQYMLNRQRELDATAAEQRAFEMEQFLKNQSLTEDQREWAKSQYEEARAQAIMQRNYGVERQDRADALAALERQFDLDQIYRAQNIAQSERNYELGKQQNILSQIDALSTTLNNTINGFGDLVPLTQYNQSHVDAEAQRRGDLYASAIDRAADRVASVNEADAIRSGMYQSTQNNARRANITAQLANEYQQAYGKGFDEAQQYISNLQAMEQGNRNQVLGEQQQKLQQLMSQLSPLELATGQGAVQSAVGPTNMRLGTANAGEINLYDAMNGFNTMQAVGSGVYNQMPGTANMASTLNGMSGIHGGSLSAPGFNFQSISNGNPANYMANAASLATANGQFAQNMYNNAAQMGREAATGFGKSMANLGDLDWKSMGNDIRGLFG